jgi:hypothetical protein
MKVSKLSLMLLVLAATALASDAAFSRGKGRSGGARSAHSGHAGGAHHHARSRVFVGAAFGAPVVLPWWTYAPYPAPAAPVYYIEQSDLAEGEWLYCQEANAYFPYVADCAGGWQRVRPKLPPG